MPGATFSDNVITYGSTGSFTAVGVPVSSYNYNAQASLSTVIGTWQGEISSGASGSVTVQANGVFSGTVGSCSLSGLLAPRATGKNVFDATLTFGPSPCAYPGTTAYGNAAGCPVSGGLTQFVFLGTAPDRSAGTAFLSRR